MSTLLGLCEPKVCSEFAAMKKKNLSFLLKAASPLWSKPGGTVRVSLFFIFISAGYASPPGEHTYLEGASIQLAIGEQRLLRFPNLVRYSVGSPNIKAIRLPKGIPLSDKKDLLLVKGIRAGWADLWVWSGDQKVTRRVFHVHPWNHRKKPTPLLKAIQQLNEVETIPVAQGFLLRGEAYSQREARIVDELKRRFPKQITHHVSLHSSLLTKGLQIVNEWIHQSPLGRQLLVQARNGRIHVRGTLASKAKEKQVIQSLQKKFPLIEFDLNSLSTRSMPLYFQVYLLELRKEKFLQFGMHWPNEIGNAYQVVPWKINPTFKIETLIKALEGEGQAKVLSHPQMVVNSPGQAELFSGGEIPIVMKTSFSQKVDWKPFGLHFRLNVLEATGKKVRVEIQTEISELDYKIASDDIPGMKSNRMKTTVDAEFGVPLFLSGLIQERTRKQSRGLPLLKDIPVLGTLFGSEDFQNENSELVAVLIPNSFIPTPPLDQFSSHFPQGIVPPPRNWLTPQEQERLQKDPNYPWNALE